MALKYTRWIYSPCDKQAAEQMMDAGYPYLVSSVLAARGVKSVEEANLFLERETRLAYSPFLMKDMDKAVERINAAIAGGEKIAVFGDYDVDGITATVLLVDYLRGRGADCVKYIPRRVEDGYGLGQEPMRHLREQGVSLLITVDCGITGVEEAEYAKSLGMDLIITDHHECKELLPDAAAVVDPHRSDCEYPFKCLAGVGVALKLVLALGGESQEDKLFARYCTLAAIGTVADVMQMSDENRTIVYRGLKALRSSDFLGLHALLKETGLLDKEVTSIQVGFVLAPRINAAGRMGEAELAADLLLTDDPNQAEKLARQLCALNRERQLVEQEIFAQAVEQIETIPENERSALVLSSDQWHQGVVGIVASRLAEKFSCPSFMIHLSGGLGKCSCRSYGGFNLFAALESCSDLLEGFGGHELAAGFTIKEENIPAFRRRINRCASAFSGGAAPVSSLEVDVVLRRPELVTLEEVHALRLLEPYGAGNNRPVFCFLGAKIDSMQSVGQNRHLKLRLSRGKYSFDAIYFSANRDSCGLEVGDRVDAAFYLQVNEFRGSRTVQLQIIDLRGSVSPSARERSCLELASCLWDDVALTPQEAARLLPGREQFVHLWQAVIRLTDGRGPVTVEKLPTLRRLACATGGAEPFLRTAVGMSVFAERGLLTVKNEGDCLTITIDAHEKVNLGESRYIRRLHKILGLPEKGGV
mgnify:CR=1 FL=1